MFEKYIWKIRDIYTYPEWVNNPQYIQIDTCNYCNYDCEYCNVKDGSSFKMSRGFMHPDNFADILSKYQKYKIRGVAPFMNGEPLLHSELPKFFDLSRDILGSPSIIDTNGSISDNIQNLVHNSLKTVRFTISASTPKTYARVHGVDNFSSVIHNLHWFSDHKKRGQRLYINFITTLTNVHEGDKFIRDFRGFNLNIFPIHNHPLQLSSIKTATSSFHPVLVKGDGSTDLLRPYPDSVSVPCQCWDIQAVGLGGELMHCTDFPPEYNYGNVFVDSVSDAWHRRVSTCMNHVCCNNCSVRFSHYKKIFERIGVKVDS